MPLTTYDPDAAAVLGTGLAQRTAIYHEAIGAEDALRRVQTELLDLLPPAAVRTLQALQAQATATRRHAFADLQAATRAAAAQEVVGQHYTVSYIAEAA